MPAQSIKNDKASPPPLAQLMHKAGEQGYLLTDDLLAVIPEAEENMAQLEEIFIHLVEQGISVYADTVEAEEKSGLEAAQQNEHKLDIETSPLDLNAIDADDLLSLYLKEAARVPLLTAAGEIALAKQIEKGHHAEKTLQKVPGGAEKTEALRAQVEAGRQARNHLIKANTRLVISIAKKYRGQGIPFSDLIQEGNLGLIKAVEKFDYHRGNKFSTYASWWIRQAVTRGLADQSRTIRVPIHMSDRIRKLHQVTRRLEQILGRKPTLEELGREMGLEPSKISWALHVSLQPVSLEEHIGNDADSNELGDFIEDQDAPAPPDVTNLHLLRERLEDIISTLTPREAKIIRLRFGLQNGRSYTLDEVGKKFGLTRERIRQIESQALRKLRHPRRARLIKGYLD